MSDLRAEKYPRETFKSWKQSKETSMSSLHVDVTGTPDELKAQLSNLTVNLWDEVAHLVQDLVNDANRHEVEGLTFLVEDTYSYEERFLKVTAKGYLPKSEKEVARAARLKETVARKVAEKQEKDIAKLRELAKKYPDALRGE